MSTSSGVLVTSFADTVECQGESEEEPCSFAGVVDVQIDPEVNESWWECPACGLVQPYEFPDEPDPDRYRDDPDFN